MWRCVAESDGGCQCPPWRRPGQLQVQSDGNSEEAKVKSEGALRLREDPADERATVREEANRAGYTSSRTALPRRGLWWQGSGKR